MSVEAKRETPRHPLRGGSHPIYRRLAAAGLLLASLAGWAAAGAASGKAQEKKKRPPEMVITGTVFTEKGFSLPGASVRVKRTGERKPKWEAVSDRRGEFGVRVPQGAEYEVHVRAEGYEEQMQKVDGKASTYENLIFRMTPATGGKKT
ncbi:MAG: carboxypeptidase regulatory-like domain-containing protein [Acidobacteria bacterium]|nr:carboxypeptidase regulatory-like domain-containing protein [Acidobacteriota bacterium]MBI3662649.1 carboxypeptidase regulatory-like domain-containing protein [Acidobacteriota bacterium]